MIHKANAKYYDKLWDTEGQIRKDVADREEMGISQIICGVGIVVFGAICIVSTAGAGTPIVATMGLALNLDLLCYSISDIIEDGNNILLGNEANLDGTAFNPIRDIRFRGNETEYMIAELGVGLAAAAMCPIARLNAAGNLTMRTAAGATAKLLGEMGISAGVGGLASIVVYNKTESRIVATHPLIYD